MTWMCQTDWLHLNALNRQQLKYQTSSNNQHHKLPQSVCYLRIRNSSAIRGKSVIHFSENNRRNIRNTTKSLFTSIVFTFVCRSKLICMYHLVLQRMWNDMIEVVVHRWCKISSFNINHIKRSRLVETDGVTEIYFLPPSCVCKIWGFLQVSQDQIEIDAIARSNVCEDLK